MVSDIFVLTFGCDINHSVCASCLLDCLDLSVFSHGLIFATNSSIAFNFNSDSGEIERKIGISDRFKEKALVIKGPLGSLEKEF